MYKTDLLSPASTINCPWGLQKILLACCLSNISVKDKAVHSVEVYRTRYTKRLFAQRPYPLTYELNLAVVFHMIEGDVDSGRFSVENCKLAAVGLPCKRYDAF